MRVSVDFAMFEMCDFILDRGNRYSRLYIEYNIKIKKEETKHSRQSGYGQKHFLLKR